MDGMQHEQFIKALNGLVELAKTKKNVLEYNEINDAFRGFELTEDKMDQILEYLEKSNIPASRTAERKTICSWAMTTISFSVKRMRWRSSTMWMCWKVSAPRIPSACT